MTKCPACHSHDVVTEQNKVEIDKDSNSHLVLRSWLSPGGILKNRKQYTTEITCTCKSCGNVWHPRSRTEIGMAIIGGVILICFIVLGILGNNGN